MMGLIDLVRRYLRGHALQQALEELAVARKQRDEALATIDAVYEALK